MTAGVHALGISAVFALVDRALVSMLGSGAARWAVRDDARRAALRDFVLATSPRDSTRHQQRSLLSRSLSLLVIRILLILVLFPVVITAAEHGQRHRELPATGTAAHA